MSNQGWKKFERRCCRDMGTERIPVTGERHGADGVTDVFEFQFKKRASLPSWLFDWLGGIVTRARANKRIGVLVMKTPGMEDRDALVILSWSDWVDLHGPEKFENQTHRAQERDRQQRARQARAGREAATV